MEYKVNKNEKLIKSLIHNIQGLSFGSAQKALRNGDVKINGKRIKDNIDTMPGDIISIYIKNKSMPKVDIVYMDDNILVANKPQGIECATRDKSSENTYSLEEIFAQYTPFIVHRLDRLTEGLVVMARNVDVAKKFECYFENKQIEKHYQALVKGIMSDSAIKTAYLKKDAKNSKVQISDNPKPDYKEITTEYNTIECIDGNTLIDITLHTGRTHQIRAHMAHLGHPVYNDSKYGEPASEQEYKGYYLTAYKLVFHLNDDMQYLNSINLEINPTWLQYIK